MYNDDIFLEGYYDALFDLDEELILNEGKKKGSRKASQSRRDVQAVATSQANKGVNPALAQVSQKMKAKEAARENSQGPAAPSAPSAPAASGRRVFRVKSGTGTGLVRAASKERFHANQARQDAADANAARDNLERVHNRTKDQLRFANAALDNANRTKNKLSDDLANEKGARRQAESERDAVQKRYEYADKARQNAAGQARKWKGSYTSEVEAHNRTRDAHRADNQRNEAEIRILNRKNTGKNIALAGMGAGIGVYAGAKGIERLKYKKYVKAHGKGAVSFEQWKANGKPLKESYADGYYAALKDIDAFEESYYYDEY